MIWDDDLPADVSFELLVYEDGDPPHVLTHLAIGHTWGDPPDRIAPIEPQPIADRLEIIRLWERSRPEHQAPTLASQVARWGPNIAQATRGGITFEYSLAHYADCDPEHTRVWITLGSRYRRELFTEEHYRIMKAYEANRDARLKR